MAIDYQTGAESLADIISRLVGGGITEEQAASELVPVLQVLITELSVPGLASKFINAIARIDGAILHEGAPDPSLGRAGSVAIDVVNSTFYTKLDDGSIAGVWDGGTSFAGKSVYELWLDQPGNSSKTEAEFFTWLANAQISAVQPYITQAISAADSASQSSSAAASAAATTLAARDVTLAARDVAVDKAAEASAGATTASGAATTATTKASEATTARNEAVSARDTASTHAATATTKASEASTSAATATTKAGEAETARASAVSARNDAQTAATSASESASTASGAATTSVQARDAALAAQTAAEAARDQAQAIAGGNFQPADPTLTAVAGQTWSTGKIVFAMTAQDVFTPLSVGVANPTDLLDRQSGDARFLSFNKSDVVVDSYEPVDLASRGGNAHFCYGMRSNLLLRSQEIDNSTWVKTGGVTVTANAYVSPRESTEAERLNAGSAGGGVEQVVTHSTLGWACFPVWLFSPSAQGGEQVQLVLDANGTSAESFSKTVTLIPGWGRYFVAGNFTAAHTQKRVRVLNGAAVIGMWGAQLDTGTAIPRGYHATSTGQAVNSSHVAFFTSFDGTFTGVFSRGQTLTTTRSEAIMLSSSAASSSGTPIRISPSIRQTARVWNGTADITINNWIEVIPTISGANYEYVWRIHDGTASIFEVEGRSGVARASGKRLLNADDLDVLNDQLDDKQSALGFTPENAANKGQANGYASLNANGKVPASQLDGVASSTDVGYLFDREINRMLDEATAAGVASGTPYGFADPLVTNSLVNTAGSALAYFTSGYYENFLNPPAPPQIVVLSFNGGRTGSSSSGPTNFTVSSITPGQARGVLFVILRTRNVTTLPTVTATVGTRSMELVGQWDSGPSRVVLFRRVIDGTETSATLDCPLSPSSPWAMAYYHVGNTDGAYEASAVTPSSPATGDPPPVTAPWGSAAPNLFIAVATATNSSGVVAPAEYTNTRNQTATSDSPANLVAATRIASLATDDPGSFGTMITELIHLTLVVKPTQPTPPTVVAFDLRWLAFTTPVVPNKANVFIEVETFAGTLTLNTNLFVDVSRDGGTTWSTGVLVVRENVGAVYTYQAMGIDLTSQPSGSSVVLRIRSNDDVSLRVHGAACVVGG